MSQVPPEQQKIAAQFRVLRVWLAIPCIVLVLVFLNLVLSVRANPAAYSPEGWYRFTGVATLFLLVYLLILFVVIVSEMEGKTGSIVNHLLGAVNALESKWITQRRATEEVSREWVKLYLSGTAPAPDPLICGLAMQGMARLLYLGKENVRLARGLGREETELLAKAKASLWALYEEYERAGKKFAEEGLRVKRHWLKDLPLDLVREIQREGGTFPDDMDLYQV